MRALFFCRAVTFPNDSFPDGTERLAMVGLLGRSPKVKAGQIVSQIVSQKQKSN